MLIGQKIMFDFLRAYEQATKKRTTHTLVFIDFDALQRNKNKILELVPEESRVFVEELIEKVLANKERMIKARNLGEEEFARYAQRYIILRIEGFRLLEGRIPDVDPEAEVQTVAKYFPVPVTYRDKNGEVVEGYLFMPEPGELRRVYTANTDTVLARALRSGVRHDPRTLRIAVGDMILEFADEESFIKALAHAGKYEDALDIATREVARALPEDIQKRATLKRGEIVVSAKLTDLGAKIPPEFEDTTMKVVIEINPLEYPYVNVRGHIKGERYAATIETIGPVSKNVVGDIIKREVKKAQKDINSVRDIAREVFEYAAKHGYEAFPVSAERTVFGVGKGYMLIKGSRSITVIRVGRFIHTTGQVRRSVGDREIDPRHLYRFLRKSLDLITMNIEDGVVTVNVAESGVALNKVDFMLDTVEKALDKFLSEFDTAAKTARRRIPKVTPEHAAAYYLLVVSGYPVSSQAALGRKLKHVEGVIEETLKNVKVRSTWLLPDEVVSDANAVVTALIEGGFIDLTPKADVVINGKRFDDLIRDFGVTIPEKEREDTIRKAATIVANVKFGAPPKVSKLKSAGFLNPESIAALVRKTDVVIPPKALTRKYGEGTIWDALDDETKTLIIERATRDHLYEMATNPAFSDKHEEIVKALISEDRFTGTDYLGRYEPGVISEKDRLRVVNGFIVEGDYAITVTKIDSLTKDSIKEFAIVARRYGISGNVRARTIEEAIEAFEKEYLREKEDETAKRTGTKLEL